MDAKSQNIVFAGRSEAERMKRAVADAAPDDRMTMKAGQFAQLANLIDSLCEIALDNSSGALGDPRYWVPLEEYARLKRKQPDFAGEMASPRVLLGNRPNVISMVNPLPCAKA